MRFWGVRGSIPSPGPKTARYGGNTPCVEIRCGDELIIFDLGTGIRELGASYGPSLTASIFVSHYHYDHLQGLPFFTPMFHPKSRVVFYGPSRAGRTVKDVIVAQMQQPFFPVTAEMVFRADVDYRAVAEGDRIVLGDAVVTALEVKHPGGNLAYRVHYRGKSVVYATDAEHGDRDGQLIEFAKGADLLIFDAMYSEDEYNGVAGPPKIGWGHSTWEQSIKVANGAGVGKLCLFHHDPTRDDDALDALLGHVRKERKEAMAAAEGQIIKV
ncbi:MAG: MBL fold metallo-hydrolase [Myxococcaceae bacterium]|nr:MBL fold metallo-hydrolase [Myxococcaceae bacterium]